MFDSLFTVISDTHSLELRTRDRELRQRMQWSQFDRVDRLERALKAARGRLQQGPSVPVQVN